MVVRRSQGSAAVQLVREPEVGLDHDPLSAKADHEADHATANRIIRGDPVGYNGNAWISDAESGSLLGCRSAHVHRLAKEHGWRTREETCRGGRRKLFNRLDVLSWKAVRDGTPLETPDPTLKRPVRSGEDLLTGVPEKARQEVYRRMNALVDWDAWRKDARGDDAAFVEAFQAAHPDMRCSRPTLYRWKAARTAGGPDAMVSGYYLRNAVGPEIDQQLQMHFDKLYLHQNRRSVRWCYEVTSVYAEEIGVECPSLSTFHRHVDRIPPATRILGREGEKAWKDKCGPFMMRDIDLLRSNEVINSDHHQFDFLCIGESGKPVRPWVTVWEDVRSGVCLGFALIDSPSSTSIFIALKRAIEKHGIPEHILVDNGKDYRSRDLTGGRPGHVKVQLDVGHAHSLVDRLKCEIHFAIPYNARSKPAERMFLEWKNDFSRGWETFCGGNTLEKPERLAGLVKRRAGMPTWIDVEDRLADWIENVYNRRPHARTPGMSRMDVYEANLLERRVAPPESLALMCMRTRRLTVGRNGVKLYDHWYDSDDLDDLRAAGIEVLVHWDPQQLGTVHVADLHGRVLCTAHSLEMAQYLGGEAQYKAFATRNKARRAKAKAVLDELAAADFGDPMQRLIDKGKRDAEAERAEGPKHPAPVLRPVELVKAMKGLTRSDDPVAERERKRADQDHAMRILTGRSA